MKKQKKYLVFFLVAISTYGISLCSFSKLGNVRYAVHLNPFAGFFAADSSKIDSGEVLLDTYNRYRNYQTLNAQEINKNASEIKDHEREIQNINTEIARYKNENEKLKKLPAKDSIVANLDSIKRQNEVKQKDNSQLIIEKEKQINKITDILKILLATNDSLEKQKPVIEKKIKSQLSEIQRYFTRQKGSMRIRFKGESYYLFVADLDIHDIKFHWKNKGAGPNSIRTVLNSQDLQKDNALMVTNAGMYTPDFKPQGLYVENKKAIIPLDTTTPKTDANFYLKPNGVFYIDTNLKAHIEVTQKYKQSHDSSSTNVRYATQSGPMLVIDGEINPSFTPNSYNKKIRSGVGFITEKSVVFAITIDEANFYDFALLFKDVFNCENALFLDGAISSMYLRDINQNAYNGQFGPMISVSKKSK